MRKKAHFILLITITPTVMPGMKYKSHNFEVYNIYYSFNLQSCHE